MIRKITLVALLLITSIGLWAQSKATISIDSSVKFQHVTGFGGFSPSPQWAYWLNDNMMDKLFGKGDNQLGLNILRLYIANNKSGWGASVANAKRAKKYGAFVFASPWSPPASWKSNNSDINGGSLLESRYGDWATYLNDYYLYMKNQGVEIDAVSVQNEPDWTASYQSCIWTGEQIAKFLRLHGSKIQCKIIAPEAIHFTKSVHEPILNDDEACKHLDILGGHFYGWDGSSYPLAAQKGKEVWMTEFLINERQENENKNIDWNNDGFLFARSINDAMLANMSAWVHYSLKRYYGCVGDGTYGTTNDAITKRGYILSHYAKYVSGTTRVKHSLTDATNMLSSSAYLTESGDSVVVMLLNPGSGSVKTSFILPFNAKEGKQIVTTGSQNMTKTNLAWDEETYSPEIEVLPYSVNTFIFRKNSSRSDIPEESDDQDVVYSEDFSVCGASCIPTGWISMEGTEKRTAGQYALGPRIMSFSSEGAMTNAFYFRSTTEASGYITYGEDANYRLSLDPGDYILKYSVVGWKSKPTVGISVRTTSGTSIASTTKIPDYVVSAYGSSSRISQTTDGTLSFSLKETTNCVLRFLVTKGYQEVLVGNISLVRQNATGIVDVNRTAHATNGVMYDLMGRKISDKTRPGIGIYIKNGKKQVVGR